MDKEVSRIRLLPMSTPPPPSSPWVSPGGTGTEDRAGGCTAPLQHAQLGVWGTAMSVVSPQQDQTEQEEGTSAQASSDVFGDSLDNRLDHELPINTQREREATVPTSSAYYCSCVLFNIHSFSSRDAQVLQSWNISV